MKLLISGATGFIGCHLVKRLQAEGHDITVIIRPSTSLDPLENAKVSTYIFNDSVSDLIAFMQTEHFDGVVHLASLFLAQHKSEDIPALINANLLFATSLLEASVQSHIPWFINTGTFWQHYQNEDYSPVNLYAATKQAFEDIAHYYTQTSSIQFVTLKLSDTFGPGDTRPKVMNLLQKISKSGETLDMSAGDQQLDISYIDNVVDGYLQLITLLAQGQNLTEKSFAICAEKPLSLQELVKLFEQVTNTKLTINWGKRDYRPREVMVPWNKGEKIPGWQPKVSLEEGIKRTFNA